MNDLHFQLASAHATQLTENLTNMLAENSLNRILREGEVSEIHNMIGQVENIQTNICLLRRRVEERRSMLKEKLTGVNDA